MPETPLLEVRGLTVRGPGRALVEDVTLALRPGEVTVIVGENGAGKSTLLDRLAGLPADRPLEVSGDVLFGEVSLRSLPPRERARRVASLGQDDIAPAGLAVSARIGQGLVPRRGPRALLDDAARARIDVVAADLGVKGLLQRDLASLSGGERRRVQVARALVDDEAAVVLLDEPHAGVDLRHKAQVSAALRARAGQGATVVATVHQLDVARALGDRVIGLSGGRLAFDAPPADLDEAAVATLYGLPPSSAPAS